MSNTRYEEKEEARMTLAEALLNYRLAADACGLETFDIAQEVDDLCVDAEMNLKVTRDA